MTPGIRLPKSPRFPRLPTPSQHIDRPPVTTGERFYEPPKSVSWRDFLAFYFDWVQGEHVTLIGPTGQGKTTLAMEILPLRDYVLAIATKQRDPVLYQLERRGYQTVRDWETTSEVHPKIVLTAPLEKGSDSIPDQRKAVHNALVRVYVQGGWCVYLDEARYITEFLGLSKDTELLWQQGRSAGVSVVAGAQRPAWVPRDAFAMATHLFFWRTSDARDLETIGGLGAFDPKTIAYEVARLPKFTVLYLNTRTSEKVITRVTK